MFVSEHFGSLFEKDNFASRRTTGHNLFDPEALLTEAESRAGLDYDNSTRDYRNEQQYRDICRGVIPASLVPQIAPRAAKDRGY